MDLKNIFGKLFGEDDYEAFDDEEMVEDEAVPSYQNQRSMRTTEDSYRQERPSARPQRRLQPVEAEDPSKIVNIHTTAKLQVVLSKPERFDDASGIADIGSSSHFIRKKRHSG